MSALSRVARETIKSWCFGDDPRIRVTIAGYIRRQSTDGRWHGDTCGCIDDRCIGYHHEERVECHCLHAWLDEWVREQRAALEAAPIWAAYRAAVEANDGQGAPVAYADAWAAAEEWVQKYCGAGVVSFSLDVLVDGRPGISTRNIWNDRDHLAWEAPAPSMLGAAS